MLKRDMQIAKMDAHTLSLMNIANPETNPKIIKNLVVGLVLKIFLVNNIRI